MASINSTSSSSTASMFGITGKGIGGLATGLDTDSLVAALTSGTQSKIAKQGQQKQLLNWKMTAYRTMAAALTAFQTKNLKPGSASSSVTNITSNSFFNTYKATSSSSKVTASATSGAITGNFTINSVTQLAESESFSSVNKLSPTLGFDIDKINGGTVAKGMFTDQTLKLEVDGFTTKTIKLDDLNAAIGDDGTINEGVLKNNLQKLINDAYKSSSVISVDVKDGKVTLDSSSARITLNTTNDLLGLKEGTTNRIDTSQTIGSLDAFKNVQGDVLTFMINGVEISVNKSDKIEALMSKVTNSGADVRMEYDKYNDVFTLTSKKAGADSAITIRDVHGNLMSEIFGAQSGSGIGTGYLTTGNSVTSDLINKIDSMSVDEKKKLAGSLQNMTFDLTIDGVTKTVKLDTLLGMDSKTLESGSYTANDVYGAINKGIQSAFYGSGVKFSKDETGNTVVTSSKGEAFSFKASGKFAEIMGFSDGSSSVTVGNTVQDYGYSRTIDAEEGYINPAEVLGLTQDNPTTSFEMTINGVTKTITVSLDERDPTDEEKAAADFDPDKKLYSEMRGDVFVARLNQAVKAAFGDDAVTFKAKYEYEYQTVQDNKGLEDSSFDFLGENVIKVGSVLNDKDGNEIGKIIDEYKDDIYILEYKNEDGLPVKTLVNKDGNLVDNKGNKVVKDVTGVQFTLDTADSGKVASKAVILGDEFRALGFETLSNADPAKGITLAELKGGEGISGGSLTVNGKSVSYTADMTLNDFLSKLNEALDGSGVAGIKDGKLYIDSTSDKISITDTGGMLESFFGIKGGSYETKDSIADIAAGDESGKYQKDDDGIFYYNEENKKVYVHKNGKNAVLEIDGRTFEWSSNNITYNGVNLTLHDISSEKIQIGVQADPDDVIKRIKDWMDDYNALVYTLNSSINEGKNRDYSPLTDEQKSQMTDDQIKTWEAEAKKGILRNDQTLRQILADMRGALYQKVEAAGISLYDIGIVTKSGLSNPNEAGQLEFDKNVSSGGEERLRQMLLNEPDKVRMLFTDDDGIGTRLNNIITRAASDSSVNRGTLVRIAGTERLTGDNTSQLGNKIDAIDKYIATLKLRLESEYSRYWKKFSALETSVQKMNMQSSWLTSQ